MKFKVDNIELKKALAIADKGIDTTKTSEHAEQLHFKVIDNTLHIKAQSPLTIYIKLPIESIGVDFEFCLNGKLFLEFVKKCNKPIELELFCNLLNLKSGTLKTKFTLIPSDYPKDKAYNTQETITLAITAEEFLYNTTACMDAIALTDFRPILQGMNISYNTTDNKINFVAVDGLRLSKSNITTDNTKCSGAFNITILKQHLVTINGIIKQLDITDLELKINDKNITFVLGSTEVSCALLQGEFITYSRLMPKTHAMQLVMNTDSLSNAIQTVNIVSKDLQANLARMDYLNNIITLSAKNEKTECTIEVECITTEKMKDGFSLAFNSKFLIDCLKNIKGESIVIAFNSPVEPIVITYDDLYYLILPVRVIKK